ncbi:MAG TPA: hypothetical protein VMY34_03740, partial [Acidimicrobiales bacterium]|nr:hypothetical protein [Acidimicrobiales bacterium]
GLRQGPVAVVMMLIAPNAPRLAARFGANRVVATGLVGVATAMMLLRGYGTSTGYPYILLTMVVMASGMALTMSPMTASIMASVPLHKAGVGSAVNDTTRELGGALGVAVMGSLATSRYVDLVGPIADRLPAGAGDAVTRSLAGAFRVAAKLPPPLHDQVRDVARASFVSGIHLAASVGGIVILLTAALVLRFLPASLGPSGPSRDLGATRAEAVEHTAELGLGGVPTVSSEGDELVDETTRRS